MELLSLMMINKVGQMKGVVKYGKGETGQGVLVLFTLTPSGQHSWS